MAKNMLTKRERAQLETSIATIKDGLKAGGTSGVGFKIAAGYANSLKGLLLRGELDASRKAYALNLAWFLAGAAVGVCDAPTIQAAYLVLEYTEKRMR